MNKETFELAGLIEKFLLEKTSPEEEERMHSLLKREEYKDLLDYYKKTEKVQEKLDFINRIDVDKAWDKVGERKDRKLTFLSNFKYAAVFLIGILFLGYWLSNKGGILFTEEGNDESPIAGVYSDQTILTLANGEEIFLTSDYISRKIGKEVLIEGNDQEIKYSFLTDHPHVEGVHKLHVPHQKMLKVKLGDGTITWLNAQSSISFPIGFDEIRKVSLKGEAFFDVKHDASRPFIVDAENSTVKVLGTKFNVKSSIEKTTTALLEGKVEFFQNDQSEILRPGEGATADGFKLKKVPVDLELITAWKNGMFLFEKSALSEVLDEIGRWYGFEINGAIDELKGKEFSGRIKRDTPIDQLILIIQDVCPVNIQLKERTLEVSVNR